MLWTTWRSLDDMAAAWHQAFFDAAVVNDELRAALKEHTRAAAGDVASLRAAATFVAESVRVAEGGEMIYVPAGFAHGFQTLSDDDALVRLIEERCLPQLEPQG